MIGKPIFSSTNSMYFLQFSGRSSYFLMPLISHFHPGRTSSTGFAFSRRCVVGNSVVTSPSISYPTHTGISSKYPSTSNTVKATSVVPWIRQPYLEATQSNHCAVFAAVAASASQLICLIAEDLRNKCSCSYST